MPSEPGGLRSLSQALVLQFGILRGARLAGAALEGVKPDVFRSSSRFSKRLFLCQAGQRWYAGKQVVNRIFSGNFLSLADKVFYKWRD